MLEDSTNLHSFGIPSDLKQHDLAFIVVFTRSLNVRQLSKRQLNDPRTSNYSLGTFNNNQVTRPKQGIVCRDRGKIIVVVHIVGKHDQIGKWRSFTSVTSQVVINRTNN